MVYDSSRIAEILEFCNGRHFMSDTKPTLLAGPVRPALLAFAGPMILTMVATQLYTVVDTMIIGLCLDANALAAVSNASTALLVFLFVSGGMELGGGLLLAAKRPTATPRELSAVIYNLLFIDVVLGLIMTAGAFLGIEGLLRLIHTPAEIIPQAVTYSRFYLVGLPFLMVYDLSKQLIMGCGDSKTPLFAVLGTSVLNILLDLALVGPFGVAGAAAATSFSQVVGFVFILWYLHRTLLTEPFRFSMLDRRYALETFRLSAPNALQQASAPVGSMVKQGLLGGIGVAAIAGFSCASKISTLLLMPVAGSAQALVFFIAQNITAGQPDRVRDGVRQARGMMLIYGLTMSAGCILLARPLMQLFTADASAIAYGALLLSRQSIVYTFTGMRHIQEAGLRGRQQMGLYLVSNLGSTAADLLACVALVPLLGYSGFYFASFFSAPFGFLLATLCLWIGSRRAAV